MKPIFTLILLVFSLVISAQNRWYVNLNAAGLNNGTSWANAYFRLNDALAAAQSGDEIWVATGIYTPIEGSRRDTSFVLASGVRLYGGFAGFENALQERNWAQNPSILSGDVGIPGDSTDNSYTIMYMDNPDSTTVLDGLTFRHGIANYSPLDQNALSPWKCGGALYINGADGWAYAHIRHCRFERNYAYTHGGAVFINGIGIGSIAPQFEDCVFIENKARLDGGAVYKNGGSWVEVTPDFSNCQFLGNQALRRGGGLCYNESERTDSVDLYNCLFMDNYSGNNGGGANFNVGRDSGTNINLIRCMFENNSSSTLNTGGSAYSLSSLNGKEMGRMVVFNSSFKDNKATSPLWHDNIYGQFICQNSFFINNYGYLLTLGNFSESIVENCSFNLGNESILSGPNTTFVNNIVLCNHELFMYLVGQQSINIQNNIIFSSGQKAFKYDSPGYYKLTNNLVWASQLLEGTGSATFEVKNCLLLGWSNQSIGTVSCQLNFDNNYIDNRNSFIQDTLSPFITSGPNNLFDVDPLFRDTASGDYTLLPCSPLINAGDNTAVAGVQTDLNNASRIQNGTVDIGPYEAPGIALASLPQIHAACSNSAGGSISIVPVNGCEPLSYHWEPPAGNGPVLTDLPAGQYRVTVTDTHGWQYSDTINVPVAPSPQITGTQVLSDVSCGSLAGGSASVNVANGTAPYFFLWSNGMTGSPGTMLPAGQSSVTVTDINGCTDSVSVHLLKQGQLTLLVDGTPIACHDEQNGQAAASSANGKAPFSYQWSQGGMDSLITALGPGQYTVTVTDAFGCTSTFSFNFSNPALLQVSIATVPSSQQTPNGSATAMPQGGSPAYAYAWNTGAQTQQIAGLPPGTYTVTITDTHGCTTTASAVVQLMSATQNPEVMQVKVWPNPAGQVLQFQGPEGASGRVLLYDLLGRQAMSGQVSGGRAVLELGALPQGVYQWRWEEAGVVKATGLVERM